MAESPMCPAPTNEEIAEHIKILRSAYALSRPNADNENYACSVTLADARRIADALEALASEREWNSDMEAAHKEDGLIDILIQGETRWCDCYYDRICDQWRTSRPGGHLAWVPARSVTHWRKPPPPASQKQEG